MRHASYLSRISPVFGECASWWGWGVREVRTLMAEHEALLHVRPWWRRQWLSMRRDHFTRREVAVAILGDVLRGFRAKYVRRVP